MKILVTGGAGFIGNHLCRKLLEDNHTVVCIDNLYTGSLQNIEDLIPNPNFTFTDHNIIDQDVQTKIPPEIDQIYHLACPASPPAYQLDPIYTIQTNVLGTMNVLEIARLKNARILLSSTSEIYGDPRISPQVEEYWGNVNPIGIRSCYDEGKRISETLMIEYNRKYGLAVRIARIFNTYGPNMDKNDGRVVSNFINQCIVDHNITIYGDGSQTRSFCYVADTVRGLIQLMNNEQTIGPINIGNPHEITVKKLADIVKTMTNSASEIIYMNLPSDDPMKRKPDITKAKQFLNWEPEIQLAEGLENTICYFSSLLFNDKKNLSCFS
jgi:UDP-glucuronate decarboxylase